MSCGGPYHVGELARGIVPRRQPCGGCAGACREAMTERGVGQQRAQRIGESARVAWRNEQAGCLWHRLWDCAARRRDNRQAVRQGFGESHSVAFEMRGENEYVGAGIKLTKLVVT